MASNFIRSLDIFEGWGGGEKWSAGGVKMDTILPWMSKFQNGKIRNLTLYDLTISPIVTVSQTSLHQKSSKISLHCHQPIKIGLCRIIPTLSHPHSSTYRTISRRCNRTTRSSNLVLPSLVMAMLRVVESRRSRHPLVMPTVRNLVSGERGEERLQ